MPAGDGWAARNPGQSWTTTFDGRGFLTQPQGGGWQWGLELQSYGFGEQQTTVTGKPETKADGQRLTYQWDGNVQEWYVNDQRGLEHGFIVNERPEGAKSGEALSFKISTRGTLTPRIADGGKDVSFQEAGGTDVLHYSNLKVWDADGKILPAHFEPSGTTSLRLNVQETGARYPITIDPVAYGAYLKPGAVGMTQAGDWFGHSVSISGDTVVVGAPKEDSTTLGVGAQNGSPNDPPVTSPATVIDSGAAYVFVRNPSNNTWSQQAYLKPTAAGPAGGVAQANDQFGFAVCVRGNRIVVGAPFEDSRTNAPGVNGPIDEGSQDSGAAYIFDRSGLGTWQQVAYLKGRRQQAGDLFGTSVALGGERIVVGAPRDDSNLLGIWTPGGGGAPNTNAQDSGAVYVFSFTTNYVEESYLKPAVVDVSTGGQAFDRLGTSVDISGSFIIAGAPYEDSDQAAANAQPNGAPNGNSILSGACYLYELSGVWIQRAFLKSGNVSQRDFYGTSVAIDGNAFVIGAPGEQSSTTGVSNGTTYQFNDVYPNNPTSGPSAGAAYVYRRNGPAWSHEAYLKPKFVSTSQYGDGFGYSVAISGEAIAVGAPGEWTSLSGINPLPDELAHLTGSVNTYSRTGSDWNHQSFIKSPHSVLAGNHFGLSVAISGDKVVIGAIMEDSTSLMGQPPAFGPSNTDAGAAYIVCGVGPCPPEPEIVLEQPAGTPLTAGVLTWGDNNQGQTSPLPAATASDIVAVAAGAEHSLAVTGSGQVVPWGSQLYGLPVVPTAVQGSAIAVSAGDKHSVALRNDGTVFVWGDDSVTQRSSQPMGLNNVIAISAGWVIPLR